MKLYYAPGACSLAPHIVAREGAIDIQLEKVDFKPDGSRLVADGRSYWEINHKGAVPALELDDGELMTENAVILQYLASLAPQARLGPPPEGMARWRFLELLNFIATDLHKGFSPLFRQPPPEWRAQLVEALLFRFELLNRQLADRSFLAGDHFTIADAYAYVMLTWRHRHHVNLESWPSLLSYEERIELRPAVREARRREGLGASAAPRGQTRAGPPTDAGQSR